MDHFPELNEKKKNNKENKFYKFIWFRGKENKFIRFYKL